MKDVVDYLTLMDKSGQVNTVAIEEMEFAYRSMGIPPGAVILAGRFRVKKGDKKKILERMAQLVDYRRKHHPLDHPNAGSVFRNPPGMAAGKVIEELGLKGLRVGGAQVSNLHANFIVNTGNATARDFLELVEIIKEKVYQERGIELSLEVMVVGEDASY